MMYSMHFPLQFFIQNLSFLLFSVCPVVGLKVFGLVPLKKSGMDIKADNAFKKIVPGNKVCQPLYIKIAFANSIKLIIF